MAKQSTLSRSARLLLESGTLADDAVSRLVGGRDLVLSRALCRFRAYRAPLTLSGTQLAQASRAYAEAHAPFANTGMLILRAAGGAGIWYWDRDKLSSLEPVRQVSPESAWREPGEGWRVLACVEGYEAQYWEAGAMYASTWRRHQFSPAQWAAFTASVEAASSAAPAEPPEPLVFPLTNGLWRDQVVKPPLSWKDAEKVGASVAICGAAIAALFVGQALRSEQIAQHEQTRAELIQQTLRDDGEMTRALDQRRLLREFSAATQHPQVLFAVTEAHEVLSRFGLRASAWRASEDGLSLIVDAAISEAPVRDIVAAMEESPHICGALPEIAGQGRFEVRASIASNGGCDAGAAAGGS